MSIAVFPNEKQKERRREEGRILVLGRKNEGGKRGERKGEGEGGKSPITLIYIFHNTSFID